MKKLITIILLLFSIHSYGQFQQPTATKFTNGLGIPTLTTPVINQAGFLHYFNSVNKVGVHDGTAYRYLLTETLASTSYVPLNRTLTINGVAFDLSSNRSWSVGIQFVGTGSGNGSATTISIPHGLSGITSGSSAIAIARNPDSAGISYVTVDGTNVNIFYTVAPTSGTNNLSYSISIK